MNLKFKGLAEEVISEMEELQDKYGVMDEFDKEVIEDASKRIPGHEDMARYLMLMALFKGFKKGLGAARDEMAKEN